MARLRSIALSRSRVDLARLRGAARRTLSQLSRPRVKREAKHLRWYLVYGPPRTGTTLMMRLASLCARFHIGDWGLNALLNLGPEYDYIRLDRARLLQDISDNLLDNAYPGEGTSIDLVVKQAGLNEAAYKALVQMWGPPTRKIFCIREPAAYLASAKKHFSGPYAHPIYRLQSLYLEAFSQFERIGGDIFAYGPHVTKEQYVDFLSPLPLKAASMPDVAYGGKRDQGDVTSAMVSVYRSFVEGHRAEIWPLGVTEQLLADIPTGSEDERDSL